MRNEKKKKATNDTTEIQKIIRAYCGQVYRNKMENLEERDKFLEMCSLPKMNEEEIENMNRPVTNNEFENNNKTSQHTKVQDQMASQMKFTKHLGNS